MNTFIEVLPEPRIDTVVRLPGGAEARRTEYVGAAWLDGKPEIAGSALRRSPAAPRGFRSAVFDVVFFVPDSLPYDRERLGETTVTLSASLRAAGDIGAIVDASAALVDDPSGVPAWVQVRVAGQIGWPAGISYRAVVLAPVDAVR